jgi:histidyl-tRNA synthetase
MSLSTQPYKGARDFYPEDKRLQKWMFAKWRAVAEAFGYEEYDAPILEPTELYASKTSDEIVNEQTYSFVDRGGRAVTIRTEMTPSVSRMVAGRRQELPYPLRLYSVPNLWRYERPQRGRLREFWQLNVDLFGVEGIEADFEMIQLSNAIMKSFGARDSMFTIKVNSRRLVNSLMQDYLGLDAVQGVSVIRLIDKKAKMEPAEFSAKLDALLSPSQREDGTEQKLLALLEGKTLDDLPAELVSGSDVSKLRSLLRLAAESNILNIEFDITLMRGFDYYTDIVFEVFDTHPENNRSMFGGGRYDGLVAQFGVEPVPTVGFGMGDATLYNFLVLHELMPQVNTETDVYVVLVGDVYAKAQKQIGLLREMGVRAAVDVSGRKMDKQIKAAVKKGVKYVLFIGDKELENGQFTLKNLQTGNEETHSIERLVSIIKDYRKK